MHRYFAAVIAHPTLKLKSFEFGRFPLEIFHFPYYDNTFVALSCSLSLYDLYYVRINGLIFSLYRLSFPPETE